jgi:hypothetical protein
VHVLQRYNKTVWCGARSSEKCYRKPALYLFLVIIISFVTASSIRYLKADKKENKRNRGMGQGKTIKENT